MSLRLGSSWAPRSYLWVNGSHPDSGLTPFMPLGHSARSLTGHPQRVTQKREYRRALPGSGQILGRLETIPFLCLVLGVLVGNIYVILNSPGLGGVVGPTSSPRGTTLSMFPARGRVAEQPCSRHVTFFLTKPQLIESGRNI